jgi:hypothetical protein
VWLVRSDGVLLCLTYNREQEVIGWSQHRTDGLFESVCTVPEGTVNAVYVTVRRTVNGTERVYVERMADRQFTDQRDAFFVDSGLTFDGRVVSGTQTLTGGVTWTDGEALHLVGTVALWVGASDVGDQVRLIIPATTDTNGDEVTPQRELRVRIVSVVGGTDAVVQSIGDVPVEFQGVAFSQWELMRDRMSGLDHLEGATVSVLADGNVQEQKVVTGGSILLDYPAAVVHVGLPYRSMIESLDVNIAGAETVRERPKAIPRVALLVKDSRGFKSGPNIDNLYDFKLREFEGYEAPIGLYSGVMDVYVDTSWDVNGRFVVVQDDPLPATILSLIPEVGVSGVG